MERTAGLGSHTIWDQSLGQVWGQALQCHIRGAQTSRYLHRAMALAFTSRGYTQKDIAEYFGVHYSIVSRK